MPTVLRTLSIIVCLAILAVAIRGGDPSHKNTFPLAAAAEEPKTVSTMNPSPFAVEIEPNEAGIGRFVPNFSATTVTGTKAILSPSSSRSVQATVIALTGLTCPVCKRYAPSLARIEHAYSKKGVRFLFVNPSGIETDAEMRAQVKQLGLHSAYIHDSHRNVAALLHARSTTEVFVLDAKQTLMYRGAVDDQYGIGFSNAAPKTNYLTDALEAVLQGEMPKITATSAPGCRLETTGIVSKEPANTYHSRISRIVQANCQSCHHVGGNAPFDLSSYAAVRERATTIQTVVANKTMPPWFAAPSHDTVWKNDRSLSESDKKALLDWIAKGTPEGDPQNAPLPVKVTGDWQIGKPDTVFQLPEPVSIKADGTMPYQNIVVPVAFGADKWIQAVEIRPTASQVVHHVLVFVAPAGSTASLREKINERTGFFAAYVPGNSAFVYPDGFAKRIPGGANLLFQIHYTPNGTAVQDQCRIGLIFAKKPVEHEVYTVGIANSRISIPPGDENHQETANVPISTNVQILSFLPHMHLRGKACRYEVVSADGKRETLLDIPRYDFNWQLQYNYRTPKPVAPGNQVAFTAWYDNSSKNPANPDPTRTVRWGQQTYDEMMLGYVEYFLPDAVLGKEAPQIDARKGGVQRIRNEEIERIFTRLDRNNDGFLTEAEVGSFWQRIKNADANNDGQVTLEEATKYFSTIP